MSYACGSCGHVADELVIDPAERVVCACGSAKERLFSPTTNLRLAPWMSRDAEDGRARHRAWLDKPETQARIRSGELDSDLSDRHCESGEGLGNSSSIIDRAAAGLAF